MAVAARPAPVREVLETGGEQAVGTRDGGVVLCLFQTAAQAVAAVLAVQRRHPARVCVHVADLSGADGAHSAMRSCDSLIEVTGEGRTMLSVPAAAAVSDALPVGAWLQDRGRAGDERVVELLHGDVAGASRRAPAHNLPAQLTTFVGRSAELAELRILLDGHRLVMVTGAGGARGRAGWPGRSPPAWWTGHRTACGGSTSVRSPTRSGCRAWWRGPYGRSSNPPVTWWRCWRPSCAVPLDRARQRPADASARHTASGRPTGRCRGGSRSPTMRDMTTSTISGPGGTRPPRTAAP